MYRSLLVPLDGSAFGEQALPLAAHIARVSAALLRLAVVHAPHPADPIYVEGRPLLDAELRPLRREHERAYLEGVRERVAAEVPAEAVLLEGRPAEALARYAATETDFIVMTTHGRGGLERLWLGSVADGLVRRSETPLLLLRPREEEPGGPVPAFRRILIPLDGSALAEQILDHASRLGRLWGAEYALLQVIEPFRWVGRVGGAALALSEEEVTRRREAEAQVYLEGVARRLREQGLQVTTRLVESQRSAGAILKDAREHDVDVIALATHGRGGLARLLVGSVADKVLRGGHTPVLVYRPREGREGAEP